MCSSDLLMIPADEEDVLAEFIGDDVPPDGEAQDAPPGDQEGIAGQVGGEDIDPGNRGIELDGQADAKVGGEPEEGAAEDDHDGAAETQEVLGGVESEVKEGDDQEACADEHQPGVEGQAEGGPVRLDAPAERDPAGVEPDPVAEQQSA